MKIAVAGTGYVGLVTGVALAHIGHNVTCVDVNEEKIKMMKKGISPIYEANLEDLMKQNKKRITYTTDYKEAYKNASVIFIGVGTPERSDGSANLDYVYAVCDNIAESLENDCVVVVKSTVPIGTNDAVEKYLREHVKKGIKVSVASNPEFLAQGTAVRDTLHASRIVVGTEDDFAREVMEEVPKFTIISFDEMLIENYKGILEYEEFYIKLSTKIGLININGFNLMLEQVTEDDISIKGKIESVSIERTE